LLEQGCKEWEIQMRELKKLIVAHDLKTGGTVALKSAAVLARRCGAALLLVHVIEPLDLYQRASHPLTSPFSPEEIAERIGATLQAAMESEELAKLPVEYELRRGKPFVEIITAGKAWQADLIVVGATSRMEEPLLGATSERVVRKAPVPVMVAKRPLNSEAKTFLVPTDFSSCARIAAEEALKLARCFGGRVVFFHVMFPLHTIAYTHEIGVSLPILPPRPEDIEPEWRGFLAGLSLDRMDWQKETGEGEAATAILHEAERVRADMIVMGTHGRSGLPHMLLGSVTEKVVRIASCPVLTVRPEAFQFELP
jgi:nucleotide-binding universal stress UspA family protein